MAVPTTEFRSIPNATTVAAVDTAAERLALATGDVVSTGAGNELDFSTVDISGGAANSGVKHCWWEVTADGGNTNVQDFLLWLSSNGFDQAGWV
jgi:hypothetical protein